MRDLGGEAGMSSNDAPLANNIATHCFLTCKNSFTLLQLIYCMYGKKTKYKITNMLLGSLLNSLQVSLPNVNIIVMMFCFVAFFESVGRIFDYVLPNHTSIWSLMIATVMLVFSIAMFMAQDGQLTELSLNHRK